MTTPDRCGAPTAGGPCQLPPHPRGYHDPAPPLLRVPRNKNGHYQVSITQFRTYGAVDLMGDNPENVRGAQLEAPCDLTAMLRDFNPKLTSLADGLRKTVAALPR